MSEPRLLDQVRNAVRVRHYSRRTEESYLHWIKRFILFHGKRHPRELGEREVSAFLTFLAVEKNVAAATQNQALSAILFLYRNVLELELEWLTDVTRAKKPKRLPVVLTRQEIRTLFAHMDGTAGVIARLMYGSGMRIMEALRLRVKDLDFQYGQITIREGKGNKDRRTILPEALVPHLQEHIAKAKALHEGDLAAGLGSVYLPDALARKFPNAPREWAWQYVFPSKNLSRNPRTGQEGRHHLDEKNLQRRIRQAALQSGIPKRITSHTMRHCFATHLLEDGYDIRTVQELLGHSSVETTMIYTHVLNRPGRAVISPYDRSGAGGSC